ncbi:hypothetical protein TCAL_11936 [Tigriopus californicus]|uniref:Uncharacterized protein n=1 Tax=Tigriopus californicus TaxID=6832 RepID=A0A553P3N7_TIGCA|nr:hypothetical protein TCAL_11936 [Tigriopus californicus]
MADAAPSPSPPPPPAPELENKLPDRMTEMTKNEVEVGTEALRLISLLMSRTDEPNRRILGLEASRNARVAATASRSLANSLQTKDAIQNAEIAETLAETAERFVHFL